MWKVFNQVVIKRKKKSTKRIFCFSQKRKNVFKEMFTFFSRRGFQVWIQMKKDLRCANNVIGFKENIYLERLTWLMLFLSSQIRKVDKNLGSKKKKERMGTDINST